MKNIFVRTEEGIFEINRKGYVYKFELKDDCERLCETYADTLEEFKEDTVWTDLGKVIIKCQGNDPRNLCDGFYIDLLGDGAFHFDELTIYKDFAEFEDDWKSYRENNNWRGKAYGFIQTEKGLIWIAEMNEEGNLDLLYYKENN